MSNEPRICFLAPVFVLIGALMLAGAAIVNSQAPTPPPPPEPALAMPTLWETQQHRQKSGFRIVLASWYGGAHHGRLTAAGAHKSKDVPESLWRFDKDGMTAAHRTLPFGTRLLVGIPPGKWVVVVITDRGPYPTNGEPRELDLSEGAARQLGMIRSGLAFVETKVLP